MSGQRLVDVSQRLGTWPNCPAVTTQSEKHAGHHCVFDRREDSVQLIMGRLGMRFMVH